MESYALGISHVYLNLLYMKRFFFVSFGILFTLLVVGSSWYISKFNSSPKNTISNNNSASSKKLLIKLSQHAQIAKQYVKTNGYNKNICFLVDMSIESGCNRLNFASAIVLTVNCRTCRCPRS